MKKKSSLPKIKFSNNNSGSNIWMGKLGLFMIIVLAVSLLIITCGPPKVIGDIDNKDESLDELALGASKSRQRRQPNPSAEERLHMYLNECTGQPYRIDELYPNVSRSLDGLIRICLGCLPISRNHGLTTLTFYVDNSVMTAVAESSETSASGVHREVSLNLLDELNHAFAGWTIHRFLNFRRVDSPDHANIVIDQMNANSPPFDSISYQDFINDRIIMFTDAPTPNWVHRATIFILDRSSKIHVIDSSCCQAC